MGSSSLTRDRTQAPFHWQLGVLTTGPPGRSLCFVLMWPFVFFIVIPSDQVTVTHLLFPPKLCLKEENKQSSFKYNFLGKTVKCMKSLSRVRLFVTPRAVAYWVSPSMGFSGQGYWSGLPFPSPGDLPDPGIEPRSPALQADALPSEPLVDLFKITKSYNCGNRVFWR